MTQEKTSDVPRFKDTSRTSEILEIAAKLFYERGYSDVGMRLIAETTGISVATLYYHFTSKADILLQIAFGVTKEFVERLLPLLEEDATMTERLQALIRCHIERRWERRYWISTALRELRQLDPELRTQVDSYLRHYFHTVQKFIEVGVAEGTFVVTHPRIATLALFDMIHGINDWFQTNGTLSIDEIAVLYAEYVVYNLLGSTQ